MPTFLHVDDIMPLEPEQPCQGSLPDLKLDWQPPAQLLVARSSLASLAAIEFGAAEGFGVGATDAVCGDDTLRWWATTVRWWATTCCLGLCALATCLGASTTTSGSAPEVVAACDMAEPNSSGAAEKIARARCATERDESLMTMSSQMQGRPIPSLNAKPNQ